MVWQAWFTIAVVLLCLGLLASNRGQPEVVLMGGLTLLMVSGVLKPSEALAGFANDGLITVAVMYVVVAGLRDTGAIAWLVNVVLGRPRSVMNAQLRMMIPVAAISSVINNTPVVAVFIPAISDWARKHGISVSKLMIPLSYATIVGGTCTLIGTSTNLVVNGLMVQAEQAPLHLFELAWIGVPVTCVTLLYLIVAGKWLLPERKPVVTQFDDARRYTVDMVVDPTGPLVGKSIEQAGLRHLPGLFLVAIERRGNAMPAVDPTERLEGDDRLAFAGVVESVIDLRNIRGLSPATDQVAKLATPQAGRCLVEAVVSHSCPIVNRSIREGRFRSLYNAAVIAVARDGEQIKKKIGDIVLRPGDTLLLETHPSFADQHRNSRDFYLVSRLENSAPVRHQQALLAGIIMLALIATVTTGVLSMLEGALLAAGLMILTRCTTQSAMLRAVDWSVLIMIAASFGLGKALEVTGAAEAISGNVLSLSQGDAWLTLAIFYAATLLLTELVSNNAAAVLMFPIAIAVSAKLGVSFVPFAIVLMIAASCGFATPIGYQTNLMVYGPGGYRFADYLRIGVPLDILVGLVTIVLVPLIWPFH